jgi:adenylate cyclase, class 2
MVHVARKRKVLPVAQNLELKARHADLRAAAAAVERLGAREPVVEDQTDTYFRVPRGRLKLREIGGGPAVLIWYDRPDRADARTSTYQLVPVPDPNGLRAALSGALAVRGAVRKRRTIYLWHNVRIHLDQVDGLGTFVEFEAVLSPGEDEPTARARLEELGRLLGIGPADHLAPSYADLLEL